MAGYFDLIASELGISIWLVAIILVGVAIWDLTWRCIAVWKSTKRGNPIWSIAFVLFQTVGILPILYIFVFSKMKCCKPRAKKKKKKK